MNFMPNLDNVSYLKIKKVTSRANPIFSINVLEYLYDILKKDSNFLKKSSGGSYYECALASGLKEHVQFVLDKKLYRIKFYTIQYLTNS